VIRNARSLVVGTCIAVASAAAHAFPFCDDINVKRELTRQGRAAVALVNKRDYDAVDKQLNAVLEAYRAGRSSDVEAWWIFEFFRGSNPSGEPLMSEWVAKHPKSEAAHLAQAYYYAGMGWNARGTKFAAETSRNQMEAMASYFRKAMQSIDAAEKLSRKPSLEWALRIEIMKSAGDPEIQAVYRRALEKYPDGMVVPQAYLLAATPRWGGSEKLMQQAMKDITALGDGQRRYLQSRVDAELAVDAWSRNKDSAGAIRLNERALASCAATLDAAKNLRWFYGQAQNWEGVVKAASVGVTYDPADAEALANRGWGYDRLNKVAEARADLERAVQLNNVWSMERLAAMHEHGRGGPRDLAKAHELYLRAHDRGSASAKVAADRTKAQAGKK
jgi:tetratricopeptide (TPR) repeat protein